MYYHSRASTAKTQLSAAAQLTYMYVYSGGYSTDDPGVGVEYFLLL